MMKLRKMKKKSYFEVSQAVSRWLTAALCVVVVCHVLTAWGNTFAVSTTAPGGMVGRGLSAFVGSAVGSGLVCLLLGGGQVLLLDFLRRRPETLEVVLTGRDPSQRLLDAADYVTEMRKRKHPFDRGVAARRGVEF